METLDPISPELVLVTPELRTLAIGALWENGAAYAPAVGASDDATARPILGEMLLYAVWQALTGALFGMAAFLVFVALLLLKPLIDG